MAEFVFDTEAIIACLHAESGHESVATTSTDVFDGEATGSLSKANASEVFHLVARFEGTADDAPTTASLRDADRDLRALKRRGLQLRTPSWHLVRECKAVGDISLADANAVALAAEHNATLVLGANNVFDDLALNVELSRFRTGAV